MPKITPKAEVGSRSNLVWETQYKTKKFCTSQKPNETKYSQKNQPNSLHGVAEDRPIHS